MRLGIKGKQVIGVTSIVGVVVVVLSLVHLANLARVSLEESRARAELLANPIYHRARGGRRRAWRSVQGAAGRSGPALDSGGEPLSEERHLRGDCGCERRCRGARRSGVRGTGAAQRGSAEHAAVEACVRAARRDLFRAGTKSRVPPAAADRQHGIRLDPDRRIDAADPAGPRSARSARRSRRRSRRSPSP